MNPDDLPVFYSLRDIARECETSTSTIAYAIGSGRLVPSGKMANGNLLFTRENIDRYKKTRRHPTPDA